MKNLRQTALFLAVVLPFWAIPVVEDVALCHRDPALNYCRMGALVKRLLPADMARNDVWFNRPVRFPGGAYDGGSAWINETWRHCRLVIVFGLAGDVAICAMFFIRSKA